MGLGGNTLLGYGGWSNHITSGKLKYHKIVVIKELGLLNELSKRSSLINSGAINLDNNTIWVAPRELFHIVQHLLGLLIDVSVGRI